MVLFVLVLLALLSNVSAFGVSKRFGLRDEHPSFLAIHTRKRPSSLDLSLSYARRRGTIMKAAASSHPLHFDRHFAKISVSTSLRGGAAVLASSTGVPPLKLWIGPSLLCALSYALYNIFIKKASSSIDPLLGGALLQFVAALLGTLLLVGKRALGKSASVPTRANGVLWAIAAGAAVGAAEILSFSISSMGVQAMQSIPIVIGGSVLFGTVLGTVVLKEVLGVRGWSGVILIAAGIALVGLDPGTSGLH